MHKLFRRGRVRLVFDLSEVPFCDSSGLGVLVGGFKRTRACGGSFRLTGVSPHLLKTLTITGLTKVFPVHADVAEAVAADNAASSREVVGL
jgi:anti-sigma B factor antagonist